MTLNVNRPKMNDRFKATAPAPSIAMYMYGPGALNRSFIIGHLFMFNSIRFP